MSFFTRLTNNKPSKVAGKSASKPILNSQVSNKPMFSLPRKNAWFLLACQCLNIGIIGGELSRWMLGVIVLSLIWQTLLLKKANQNKGIFVHRKGSAIGIGKVKNNTKYKRTTKPENLVSPFLLGLFALLGCLAIAVTAKQEGLLVSMLNLLCISYALKAFELKTRGDFYQLILLGIFVIASSLIFRQDLAFSLIIVILLVINLAVLLQFFTAEKSIVADIKLVAVLLAQSAILAAVLFVVFPMLSPFWQMPSNKSAETGLSDSVKPGDIANLVRSTKLAFRADFGEQVVPNYEDRYWRAMVLEDYDGRQWTRNKLSVKSQVKEASINAGEEKITPLREPLSYQITVEPSFQKYLFALAPAVSAKSNRGIIAKDDYTFISEKTITQAKSYQLTSYLSAPLSLELSKVSRTINLYYPQNSNPKLEQMALQLAQDHTEPTDRAQAVLDLIYQQNYSYTLQPPLLSNNSLDQFFFDTQAGFCVHYASAFTFIMRASGIPARMVTGYLGGEFNGNESDARVDTARQKGHLSIYQYDAHAWSEIWVQDKGWVRIDPTSAVDPQRVNSGWSDELLQLQSVLNDDIFTLYQFKNTAWLNSLRLQFDLLDYQWTRWVIGFSNEQQVNLFKHWFGKITSWKLALIIAVSPVLSMLVLALFLHLLNRSKQISSPLSIWQLLYQKAVGKLAKLGVEKPISMTANAFAKQVRAQYPELSIAFTRLTATYTSLSYKSLTKAEQIKLTATMQRQYKDFCQVVKKQS